MVSWQEEKEKYLSMSADNKRNVYKGREYVKLDAIPTWKQYATEHHTPAGQTDHASTPLRHPIDATKNEKLAEKVSVFIGDITSLEVSKAPKTNSLFLLTLASHTHIAGRYRERGQHIADGWRRRRRGHPQRGRLFAKRRVQLAEGL